MSASHGNCYPRVSASNRLSSAYEFMNETAVVLDFEIPSSFAVMPLSAAQCHCGTGGTGSSTCSQLIKAGLKLSIQSKRKLSTCDSSSGSEQPNSKCSRRDEDCDDSSDDDSEHKSSNAANHLTPEDEDRRRRRRERNKIAATKCRMKKRERTQNLIKESEQLDTQNVDLKNQVRTLEKERRKLLEMLQAHSTNCVRLEGFNLPSKLLQSPALKYLGELEIEANNSSATNANSNINTQAHQAGNNQTTPNQQARTVIPPMSTIKCSRSNGFKAAAVAVNQQLHQLPAHPTSLTASQQLPNGYCKPSPTPQELGYLNSPSQESICLTSALQTHHHNAQTPTAHLQNTAVVVSHQLSDYIPNDNSLSLASLGLTHTPTGTPTGGDSSALLSSGVPSPLAVISTPTTATEFVKNELVESQSPYTTAQSAERFLFENNCDSFVDIKHAVSMHHGVHNLNNNIIGMQNNNSLLDFHTSSLMGSIVPFHDHISIKNDFLTDADLLEQFTGDAGEFVVDADISVANAFMPNGGCLA
ncbi:activating transcription factor 3-like [Teleopsis dalmanni]|uniref:activating transcription factor 3-like n=1 Tax=Teleopsis dalmanni TaxID=139649 RepID=UPI0018CCBB01|nr:activating transcription factor 3-like [Teleopsis dalmanni]